MKAALLLLLGLLLLGLSGLATTAAHSANDRGLFFRVHRADRADTEIYLLGSIHVGNETMYPLRAAIEDAFKPAHALVVELDTDAIDPARLAAWMTRNAQYPAGETVRDHIQPQTWLRLHTYLEKQHIPPESLLQYKPGILVNMLTMMQLVAGGLSPALGLDQHFLLAAHASDKPIIELETAEEQLEILASMPNSDAIINSTLDEIENLDTATDKLFDAWKAGNGARLQREIDKELGGDDVQSRAFYASIITRRNHTMSERIKTLSAQQKILFVVVGSGHLLGTEGIVELLKAQGFAVEQL